MMAPDFSLIRDSYGRLVLKAKNGETHEGVVPVRAFPIAAPDEGLALVGAHGHELAWVDRLSALAPAMRALLEEELAGREFMPEIQRILEVSGFVTPCTWKVQTDRGPTIFILENEEAIRRLPPPALLVADSHGIHYLIRDSQALDDNSRKLLDRFL